MPCYNSVTDYQAIADLEADITAGRKRIVRSLSGEVGVTDWGETRAAKAGWCEGCALTVLTQMEGASWVTRSQLTAAGVVRGGSFVAASHNSHAHKVGR